jgi:O-antigen/teichoic acid export membrane protein
VPFRLLPPLLQLGIFRTVYSSMGAASAGSLAVGLSVSALGSVMDFGASSAFVNAIASGSTDEAPATVSAWIARRLAPGVALLAVTFAALISMPRVPFTAWCVLAGLIAAVAGAATLPIERHCYALHDYARLDQSALVGCSTAFGLAVFASAMQGPVQPLLMVTTALGARPGIRILMWRRATAPSRLPFDPSSRTARHYLALSIIATASFAIDPLVAALVGTTSDAGSVSLISQIFLPVTMIGVLISQRVWPEFAKLSAEGNRSEIHKSYGRATRQIVLFAGILTAVLIPVSPIIGRLISSGRAHSLPMLAAVTGVWAFVYCWGNFLGQVYAGLGDLAFITRLSAVMCGCNVASSVILGRAFGPIGVVAGSVVSYVPIVLVPSLWRLRRLTSSEAG